ncbi:MAG: hypothetical protein PWR01_2259 [Clostridiales bacterium]|jgi:hypothetical protein|nr:hypothetical protein [Clostridiales bacterium]MDN5281186.1 hypothetical protein [Candidatus Ozemobacter sp.]
MSKLTLIFAAAFSALTMFAVATDYASPQGFSDTPKVNKTKNIRERSVFVRGGTGHRGFMHGK